MLKDVGCKYVIVGHSERRAIYKEDDALVARKFLAAQSQGLIPILCVGETLEERERGQTMQVVSRQLTAVLDLAGVAALRSCGDRVRAGVGDRHRQERNAGAGAGSSRAHPGRDRGAGMLRLPPTFASCTAAASRPRMPASCSRCPMSTAAWSAARR